MQGELKKLNLTVARSTIAKTLKDNGIPPSTGRTTTWTAFLKTHADLISATDFFATEVWAARGLVTHYVLFVIEHATRKVHIAGITPYPNTAFMAQVARNLTDCVDGFLQDKHDLILDNDTLFTAQFERALKDAGVEVVRTAIQAPNMSAFAERWVRSIKSECLNRMIIVGARSLVRIISSHVEHYNSERPPQGIGNELIDCSEDSGFGEVIVSERLGGLLKHYHRSAA